MPTLYITEFSGIQPDPCSGSMGAAAAEGDTTVAYEEEDTAETTRPGNVEAVEAIATQAGFTLPPGTIAALLAASDVTEQDPQVVIDRLGLVMVQAEAVE